MSVVCLILALLLLFPYVSESHPVVSPKPNKHANLLSKRRFLSPRDLHGSYSRFLEVSENSTLCPNIITHETNGKLYPTGHIHIPLHDISHDGHKCDGAGELVIRFRRRMKSNEIQHQFNITSHASGIDKMVRDILLTLDGFYFGRYTTETTCHHSHLPSNTAFFFTSQAKPFTAKVGIPFRRNPKIMFLVDNTRVCAFSGSFMPSAETANGKQPIQKVPVTSKPPVTPSPEQNLQSHPKIMPNETPREMTNNPMQTLTSQPHQPNRHAQNSLPNTLGTPAAPQRTPAPSTQYAKTTAPPRPKRAKQHTNENMKTMTPLLTSGTASLSESKLDSTAAPMGSEKPQKLKKDMFSSYPSPSQLPHHSSEGSLSKHQHKSGQPSNRPSSYPTKNSSHTASSNSSTSPTAKSYEIILSSASPRLPNQSSPSMTRPHPLVNVFNTDSNNSAPQELHSSGPMISQSNVPEPSASEMILGDSSSTCFPSSATVILSSGRIKRMDELSVGAFVNVGYGESSRIIDFSHADPTIVSSFLQFQTDSGRNLTVTSSHFVYIDNRIIPAAKVMVGDSLKLSDGRPTRVVKISIVRSRGLFNPHSLCGNIVVDGFIVSTYTLAAAPMTAHALLAPIRFLYVAGFRNSIVSKLSKQSTIVRAFTSLLSSNIHSITF